MQEKSNVVIINEALARQYFPKGDALGQRVTIDMTDPRRAHGNHRGRRRYEICRHGDSGARGVRIWPHPQLGYNAMTLTVRTKVDPLSLRSAVEAQVHALDKDQPVSEVRTMEQWVAKSLAQARFSSRLLMIFAGLALVLAAVGIYGVMSYAVNQRTSEIGVRMALGAEERDILRMIVRDGVRLASIGLGIGALLALALSRALTSLLFNTVAADPITYVAVIGTLGVITLAASYLPARRASRVLPIEALRYQ